MQNPIDAFISRARNTVEESIPTDGTAAPRWYVSIYAGDAARRSTVTAGPVYLTLVLEASEDPLENAVLCTEQGQELRLWLEDELAVLENDPAPAAWIRLYQSGKSSPAVTVPVQLHAEDKLAPVQPGNELAAAVGALFKRAELDQRLILAQAREMRMDRQATLRLVVELERERAAGGPDWEALAGALSSIGPGLSAALMAWAARKQAGEDGRELTAGEQVDQAIATIASVAHHAPQELTEERLGRLWMSIPDALKEQLIALALKRGSGN